MLASKKLQVASHREIGKQLLVLFVLFHVPYAFLIKNISVIAIAQAWMLIIFGFVTVLFSNKDDTRPLYVLGYLVGSEVLWRILGLSPAIPWFAGTYTVVLISIIGITRRYANVREWPGFPLFYLLALLPSLIMIIDRDLAFLRASVVQNLAGPVALGLLCIYLNGVSVSRRQLLTFSYISLAPICAIWAISAESTLTQEVFFGRSANFAVTAGFGPNQVSNTLAFGVVLCWLMLITLVKSLKEKLFLLSLVAAFLSIMFLSLSRGGVFTALLAVSAATMVFIRQRGSESNTKQSILPLLFITIAGLFLMWNFLTTYTDDALYYRYFEGTDSNRINILIGEIRLWLENPILGVGPGAASRSAALQFLQTHTEFTRLLAEHGVFGGLAGMLLVTGALNRYRQSNYIGRIWIATLVVFTFMYFMQSATRTVAPVVCYGLIWVTLGTKDCDGLIAKSTDK